MQRGPVDNEIPRIQKSYEGDGTLTRVITI